MGAPVPIIVQKGQKTAIEQPVTLSTRVCVTVLNGGSGAVVSLGGANLVSADEHQFVFAGDFTSKDVLMVNGGE